MSGVRTNLSSDRKQELHVPALHSGVNRVSVFVTSPAAHADRDVSRQLWLTEDRSTPRSWGGRSVERNGFPVAILNTPGHLPPRASSLKLAQRGLSSLSLCKAHGDKPAVGGFLNRAWQPGAHVRVSEETLLLFKARL